MNEALNRTRGVVQSYKYNVNTTLSLLGIK